MTTSYLYRSYNRFSWPPHVTLQTKTFWWLCSLVQGSGWSIWRQTHVIVQLVVKNLWEAKLCIISKIETWSWRNRGSTGELAWSKCWTHQSIRITLFPRKYGEQLNDQRWVTYQGEKREELSQISVKTVTIRPNVFFSFESVRRVVMKELTRGNAKDHQEPTSLQNKN